MSTADQVLAILRNHNLQEHHGGRYRCNSPFRPDSDSGAFALIINGPEHGAYTDHVSGETGSLYDLAQRLGIETPKSAVQNTKRAYDGIEDYARAHGLTLDQLTAARWEPVQRSGRPALRFPTGTGYRWRFLDGQSPHYVSEKGYQKCWYGLKAIGSKVLAGQPVVICNGEISVVTAQAHGLAAIAVTGGEAALPAPLVDELREALEWIASETTEIYVALDCDDTGQQTAGKLLEQLKPLGYKVRALDLQLGNRGDLADFCMLHGDGVAAALTACPDLATDYGGIEIPAGVNVIATGRRWYMMPHGDRSLIPPVEWLFPGEIPKRAICVLYAPPGTGKSFLAVDYALQLAQSAPVVYVASEGEYGYRARIDAWYKHHNRPEGELYMVMGAVSVMDDADLEMFLAPLHEIRPALVVIDTLADSMIGADENSTRDVGEYMDACNRIKRRLDTTVLLIHHTNKGGIQERGNIRIRGSADAVLRLIPEDDIIRLESSKLKDARAFPSRELALLPVPVMIDGNEIESAVIVNAEQIIPDDRLTTNQQTVLEAFDLEVFNGEVEVGDLVDVTDLGRGSLQRVLSRLLKLGLIDQPAKKAPYKLTDKGREALTRLTRMTRMTRMTHGGTDETSSVDRVSQPSQPSQPSHENLPMFKDHNTSATNHYQNGL